MNHSAGQRRWLRLDQRPVCDLAFSFTHDRQIKPKTASRDQKAKGAPDHRKARLLPTGGTGLLLVQMAKMRGARVIGTTSTAEKQALALENGADEVILYTETDFEAAVKELTGGKGVDVVYDSVGRTTFDKSLNCLRPRGYMVLFGAASGPVPPFDPQILNQKGSLFLTRPSLGAYMATAEELQWRSGDLFNWIAAGQLAVRIDKQFPLADAAEAHDYIEGRQTKGKILLLP